MCVCVWNLFQFFHLPYASHAKLSLVLQGLVLQIISINKISSEERILPIIFSQLNLYLGFPQSMCI